LLESAGYTVLVAQSGRQALELARAHGRDIDLLITDVIMPETNGRELAVQLRSMQPELPTLFMSGYTANIIAQHGILEGNSAFLEKPFTRRGLMIGVREALQPAYRVTTTAERSPVV
jgi:CheY-like chemotaxis protein